MALKKDITLNNGIVLNYHRIVSVNAITNQATKIEVASYVNEEQRNKEKNWYETGGLEDMNVFIVTNVYTTGYNNGLNVDNAYEYIKELDQFVGSEDV